MRLNCILQYSPARQLHSLAVVGHSIMGIPRSWSRAFDRTRRRRLPTIEQEVRGAVRVLVRAQIERLSGCEQIEYEQGSMDDTHKILLWSTIYLHMEELVQRKESTLGVFHVDPRLPCQHADRWLKRPQI